jgi:hypothetical protein
MCLTVKSLNTPSHEVIQKFMEVTGARVDGLELIPRKNDRVTFNFEVSARVLLQLLSDVANLDLVEKDPKHFEFRKPAEPAH